MKREQVTVAGQNHLSVSFEGTGKNMIVVRIARGFHWLGRRDVPGTAPKLRSNCSEMLRIPSEFASESFFHFSLDGLGHDQLKDSGCR